MVSEGQVFKNYKELCELLGEKTTTGTAKQAQLHRWSGLFSWHKEGHKIVIDEVYEKGRMLKSYTGNGKHVKIFEPYVRSRILNIDPDEYLGMQRLIGNAMRLIPMAAYNQVNGRGMKTEDFYKKHGLQEMGSFEEYISISSALMKETVVACLEKMQRNNELQYTEAEVFIAKDGRRRYLCLDGYDELVKKTEYDVCNQMAAELGLKTRGRQLVHFIKGKKELMYQFFDRCMQELLKDEGLVKDLKKQYLLVGPGRELKLENLCEYYKVVHIIDYDEERIEKARGPDYNEKRQLRMIYEDVKPRIAVRVSSSKKDVAKIEKMLFKQ